MTSVLSNLAPEACVAEFDAFAAGDLAGARAWHEKLAGLTEALFVETSPAPVKRALALQGRMADTLRLPLVGVEPATEALLRTRLAALA